VRRSVCVELVGQSVKLGFASFAVITLVLINNNVGTLVRCLGGKQSVGIASEVKTATTKAHSQCLTYSYGQEMLLELSCCNSSLTLKADGTPIVYYESSHDYVSWLSDCYKQNCDSTLVRSHCIKISRFDSTYLCLNDTGHVQYGVFGGLRLSNDDSYQTVANIVLLCL